MKLKELHGVTLHKKDNTYQVRYGRNNVSTSDAVYALNKFNSYVLIVLDEYKNSDIYLSHQASKQQE